MFCLVCVRWAMRLHGSVCCYVCIAWFMCLCCVVAIPVLLWRVGWGQGYVVLSVVLLAFKFVCSSFPSYWVVFLFHMILSMSVYLGWLYWCLLFSMHRAHTDLGLLVLMYLLCLENLALTDLPVWPMYALSQVFHVSL